MPLTQRAFGAGFGVPARVAGGTVFQRGTVGCGAGTGISLAARRGLLVAVLLLGGAMPSATAGSGAPCPSAQGFVAPRLLALGPDLWRIEARVADADSDTAQLVLAADGQRLWLVGSGPTPAFGAALACAVRGGLGQSVTDVLPRREPGG